MTSYYIMLPLYTQCCHELNLYSRAIEVLTTACNSFQGSPDHEGGAGCYCNHVYLMYVIEVLNVNTFGVVLIREI